MEKAMVQKGIKRVSQGKAYSRKRYLEGLIGKAMVGKGIKRVS